MIPASYVDTKVDPKFTDRRCPKCGSDTFEAIEFWGGATATFTFKKGECNTMADLDSVSGIAPYRVLGECACGHAWTFRKARSINDIEKSV